MFELPEPPRYRLDRPPLVQALAQVQYDVVARLASLEGVAPIQAALEPWFPYMASVQQQEINLLLGPGGVAAPLQVEGRTGWRFSDDGGWSVTIGPDIATLAVGSEYGSVSEIAKRFEAVVSALAASGVRRCMRLGVRYINVADVPPGDEDGWRSWFRPELLGWVGGNMLGGDLVASVTQTQIAGPHDGEWAHLPAGVQGIIRHGYVPPNTVVPGMPPQSVAGSGYLIDIDLYIEAHQTMSPAALRHQFDLLHSQIDRFFLWTITEDGELHFGLRRLGQ